MGDDPGRRGAPADGVIAAGSTRQPALDDHELARVRGALRLLGVPEQDVDDVLQDVQVKLLEHGPELGSRVGWACVVARNLVRDQARRRARWLAVVPRIASPDTVVEAADVELRDAVAQGLASLPPDVREVIVLRVYADLSVPAIARGLGIPEGTVKSRLHRGFAELRDRLPRESVS
jgi:RNA polymerase sigma-70 factor (ECF subfamily)